MQKLCRMQRDLIGYCCINIYDTWPEAQLHKSFALRHKLVAKSGRQLHHLLCCEKAVQRQATLLQNTFHLLQLWVSFAVAGFASKNRKPTQPSSPKTGGKALSQEGYSNTAVTQGEEIVTLLH